MTLERTFLLYLSDAVLEDCFPNVKNGRPRPTKKKTKKSVKFVLAILVRKDALSLNITVDEADEVIQKSRFHRNLVFRCVSRRLSQNFNKVIWERVV